MKNKLSDTKIDVVIPVYNGEKFIIDALNSAISQTISPNKIIVVDDGSTDNTSSLISEYVKTCKIEIKIIIKPNGGLSSARNAGIKESSGDFIAFLDADDTWTKDKLEKQLAVFEPSNFSNLGLVYCDYDVMDYNGTIKYANYKSPLDSKRMRGMVFKKLLERNQITSSGSGVLIRRKVFNVVGLFDENLRYAEDWDMWLRITQKFEVDFNPSILVHIRKHENNMTFDTSKTFENELHFYSKWISIIEGSYPAPFFWADKITFRLLSRLPSTDLISVLKNTMLRGHRKKIFRASFGSFLLYIPIFLIRQIWNAIFYPGYLQIFWGLIRHAKI